MVAKYSIVGLTAGQVLSARNSVKAIKLEFQRLVAINDSDLVVVDYQGETLVRYIGGKVLKGQHYRKFSQRGTQEPKPKAKEVTEDNVTRLQLLNTAIDMISRDKLKMVKTEFVVFAIVNANNPREAAEAGATDRWVSGGFCMQGVLVAAYSILLNKPARELHTKVNLTRPERDEFPLSPKLYNLVSGEEMRRAEWYFEGWSSFAKTDEQRQKFYGFESLENKERALAILEEMRAGTL